MDAAPSNRQDSISADTLIERQRYYRQLFRVRALRFWRMRILLLFLAGVLCIGLAILSNVAMIGVFAGVVALLAFYLAARYEPCALVLLMLFATDFIPRVVAIKSLCIYPIVFLLPLLLLILAARQAFRTQCYNWPSWRVVWPMPGLVVLAIISNVFIQVTWTPGVPHQENGNPLVYSEVLGVILYLLPLALVLLLVALLTNREHWTNRLVSLWQGMALLAALVVLVDFARLHTDFYRYRFEEPAIGWISLQGLAMPLALGCIVSYTYLLHVRRWTRRLLYAGELLLCSAALFVTLQNSWWIEVVVGVVTVTSLYSRRLLAALIVAGLALLALLQSQLVTLLSVKAGDANRLIVWQDILRIWGLHPLLGVGPGNVWTYDQRFTHLPLLLRDFNATGLGVAHNGYLQVLAEVGPLGLVLLLALLFTLGLACWRLYRRSQSPEALHDRLLALVTLGLLCGSALANVTSGAFFYPNSQIGGFNALPPLLNNWVIFALVLSKDQVWRKVSRRTTDTAMPTDNTDSRRIDRQMVYVLPGNERQSIDRGVRTSQWIAGTSGFTNSLPHVVFGQVQSYGADTPGQVLPQREDIGGGTNRAGPMLQGEITHAAGNAAIVGMGNIAGSVLKYGSNFLLQVGFGAASYGLYSVALSLILLVASICDFGLDITTTRYVAIYRSKGKIGLLRGLVIFCSSVSGIAGLLGAVLVLYLAPLFALLKQEPRLALVLQLMAPIVPLLCMQTVWLSALQGLRAFGKRVIAERLLMPALLMLLLVAALIGSHDLTAVVLAMFVSCAAGTVLSLYYLARELGASAHPEAVSYKMHEWIGSVALNFFTAFIEEVLESLDLLLLALFAVADVQIGQYSAAVKISDFIAMPLFSFNAMFAPSIAELYSNGEQQKLAGLFQVITRWTVMCSLPLYCLVTLFAYTLLGLAGDSFAAAWPLLTVSALGTMVNAATGSVGYMLLMTGHQRLALLDSLLAVLLNIVGGVLLIPHYGALGMVVTTTCVLAVINVLRVIQVKRLLRVFPYNRTILKPLFAGFFSAVGTEGLLLLLPNIHSWMQLLLMPIFLLLYVGLLLLLGVEPEDAFLMDSVRRRLLRADT